MSLTAIATIISAVVPNLSTIKQLVTKPKTMTKEAASGGIAYAGYLVYADYMTCGGFECVTNEHWGMLISTVIVLITRLNAKKKEA